MDDRLPSAHQSGSNKSLHAHVCQADLRETRREPQGSGRERELGLEQILYEQRVLNLKPLSSSSSNLLTSSHNTKRLTLFRKFFSSSAP